MGKAKVVEGILKGAEALAGAAKEVKGFGAAAEEVNAAAKAEREAQAAAKAAAIDAERAKAGTVTDLAGNPRIGLRQRELDVLKQQTVGRSGEKGWQELTGQMRARLEEGGEFPLRFSRKPKPSGGGAINPMGRTPEGEAVRLQKAVTEHVPRFETYRGRGEYYPPAGEGRIEKRFIPGITESMQGQIDRRAARAEGLVRESLSGIPAAADQTVARSAGVEFSQKGAPRGIRSIAQGISTSDDYQKLQRGIQRGVVRAAPVAAAGGYAAQGYGEIAGTYTGPAKSDRTPQVQWGRNRQ